MQIEKEISIKKADMKQMQEQMLVKARHRLLFLVSAVVLGAVIGIFVSPLIGFLVAAGLGTLGYVAHSAIAKLEQKRGEEQTAIHGFEEAHKLIRRNYKVHKLGVAYVPVATQIPFEAESILIDHTGSCPEKEFNLYLVRNQAEFTDTVSELEKAIAKVPLVETSKDVEEVDTGEHSRAIQKVPFYDYFGNLDRRMRSAAFLLNDLEKISVSMPIVMPSSPFAKFLKIHATKEIKSAPTIEVFSTSSFNSQVEKFMDLNDIKKTMENHTQEFEVFVQGLMTRLAETVQGVSRLKLASTNRLTDQANKILFASFKASFHHYSPQLEAEEIERIRSESFDYEDSVDSYQYFNLKQSSTVKFDPISWNWVAEDGSRTSFPFAVHQIHEEIVIPIIRNLMLETRAERMSIYNSIKDQKIDYLNQWHRDTDDFYGRNRAEGSDLLNLMQSSLTEFTAAFNQYKAFEETQKSLSQSGSLDSSVVNSEPTSGESVVVYQAKSTEFAKIQQEFNEYMDRLKEEIDCKAERFAHIEYYDASLQDGESQRRSAAISHVNSLDSRRKPLVAVDPYFAEVADLPPVPDLASSAFESLSINLSLFAEAAILDAMTPASRPID